MGSAIIVAAITYGAGLTYDKLVLFVHEIVAIDCSLLL